MLNRLSAIIRLIFGGGRSHSDESPTVAEPKNPTTGTSGAPLPSPELVRESQSTPRAMRRPEVSVSSTPGPSPAKVSPDPKPLAQPEPQAGYSAQPEPEPEPQAVPQPEPHPPVVAPRQQELIALTDFSDVVYPTFGAPFAPPPGGPTGQRGAERRQWTKRRARLHPSLVTEIVDDIAQRGADAIAVCDDEPIDVLWPMGDGGDEYLVPQLAPSYLMTQGDRSGSARTLDLALPGHTVPGEPEVDEFDRLELVRLTALLISSLHASDLVTAGITWDAFAFTVEPRPAVVLHCPERVRRIGGEFLQPPTEPRPMGWSNSPFDSDRGDFAVLAFQLLIALEADADLHAHTVEGVPGTSPLQAAALIRLWERAAGPAGSRPQLVEWLEAFEVPSPRMTQEIRS